MEPKTVMKKSIRHVIEDLDHIGAIVRLAEHQLEELSRSSPEKDKLLSMGEELQEVHARLDGVKEFVLSCQRRALALDVPPEEPDIWL